MVAIFHGFFVLYYLLDSFLRRFCWEKTLHSWLPFRQQHPLAQSTTIAGRSSRLLPLTELRRVFELFDRNKDGRITASELSDSLENLGIFISHKDLVSVLKKIDVDGDGSMGLDEFGVLWQRIGKEGEDDIREAFNVFDENGDGFITVEELQSVLLSLGLQQGRVVEDWREMVRKVDVDGDGMVNYSEFKEMMVGGGDIVAAS